MNVRRLKALLQIDAPIVLRRDREWLSALLKEFIIIARRAGNDTRAAELSEARAWLKAHGKYARCECGTPISRGKTNNGRCRMCANSIRRGQPTPVRKLSC